MIKAYRNRGYFELFDYQRLIIVPDKLIKLIIYKLKMPLLKIRL
jgi:hypothetical protein